MTKTTLPELPSNDNRKWYIVDAADKPLGRLAVKVANVLRGKDKADFAPSVDTGAFVIVINAQKVALTGKKNDQKLYVDFTGWRGGLSKTPANVIREKNPTRLISDAVWGMLPKNNTADIRMTRLKVYAGAEHPHAAQKPETLSI
ncbi:MAG: 50S ribosomal protein L13 [Kiritimatiellae bacterium]|jgi:large subunit ribosomal protein L13|nr:50S ribosomal protein L13 [Kiritimatiellia bacterium]